MATKKKLHWTQSPSLRGKKPAKKKRDEKGWGKLVGVRIPRELFVALTRQAKRDECSVQAVMLSASASALGVDMGDDGE